MQIHPYPYKPVNVLEPEKIAAYKSLDGKIYYSLIEAEKANTEHVFRELCSDVNTTVIEAIHKGLITLTPRALDEYRRKVEKHGESRTGNQEERPVSGLGGGVPYKG